MKPESQLRQGTVPAVLVPPVGQYLPNNAFSIKAYINKSNITRTDR